RLRGIDANPGILSVNHAVVASWVRLAREGGKAPGDVLSDESQVSLVFDEAHELEDSLTSAWTDSIGAMALHGLLRSLWGRRGPVTRARQATRRLRTPLGRLSELDGLREGLGRVAGELDQAVALYLHEYGGAEAQLAPQRGVTAKRPEFLSMASAAARVAASLRQLRGLLARTA